jgi:hypothetical protein
MSFATRFPAARMLVACALVCVMINVVPAVSPKAEEAKSCTLFFALPEGTTLNYTVFYQSERNFSGADVSMNQTIEVAMKYGDKPDSTGAARVDLDYGKMKSSAVMNGQLQEWTPPIKLEGSEIRAWVGRDGKVERFEPGKGILGMGKKDDLRDYVESLFIELPDTVVAVGGTWTKEIVEGKREGAEPEIKGTAVYTLKKIEKKDGVEIAVIEGKANVKLNMDAPGGTLIADGKISMKGQVAIAGGYIIEMKQSADISGDVVSIDPITDKETKRQSIATNITEIKLQK